MKTLKGLLALVASPLLTDVIAQSQDERSPFDRIQWVSGPVVGRLGDLAQVGVPATCRFTDAKGARQFMIATQNPPTDSEVGVLLCEEAGSDSSFWFVVFTFAESGFVKDDEKSSLDPAAILKTLQRGTEAGNEERRSRGWDELEVLGWQREPYYDGVTNNLTWATRIRTKGTTDESINQSVRLLGRRGVMNADLVAEPSQMAAAVVTFDGILKEYSFSTGHRYAEWRPGDKVAEYGLTALIAGGAGAAAVKLGLFGKLWKLILVAFLALKKLFIVAILGLVAFVKNLFAKRRTPAVAHATPSAMGSDPRSGGNSGTDGD